MRRVLGVALAALFCFSPLYANAASRVIVYPGQQPLSEQQNQQVRFHRLSFGTWMRDALGSNTAAAGVYSNLSVVPNGGMYVAVQPTQANTLGSLYQIGVDDSAPVPSGSTWNPTISADSTKIVLQGLQSAPSGALGPIVAPNTGLQQYYLVEAQLQTVDTSSQALTFVNTNRTTSTQTVNTQRVDQIVYQLKAGTAAASPTVPTVDSGWIPVSTVLVPSGVSSITSGMIAAEPAFSGFVANGSNVTVSGLTLSGASAGCLQTNSSGVVSSQTCTSGLGTVSGTSPISASTSAGVATVSCPSCVTSVSASGNLSSSGGTTPSISLSTNPGFTSVTANSTTTNGNATIPNSGTATSSTNYGALGAFQVEASLWNGSSAALHTWGFTADTTGKLAFQFDSAPKFTVDSSGNAVATTFTGSGAGLTNLPLNQFSGLTSGRCLRASSSTTIASASSDCLTGLTAGTGISVGTGSTPTVSIANNGVGQSQVSNGYVDLSSTQTVGGAKAFSSSVTLSGELFATGGTPSASVPFIGNDGSGTNGVNLTIPTSSTLGWRFFTYDGTFHQQAQIHADGTYQTGSSSFGPNGATFGGGVTLNGTSNTFTGTDFFFGSQATTAGNIHFRTNGYSNSDTASIAAGSGNIWTAGTIASNGVSLFDGGSDGAAGVNIGTDGVNATDAIHIGSTCPTYSRTTIGTNTGSSVQGVNGGAFKIFCGTELFSMDTSGNVGIANNVTAANFFNGSKRAWKTDISPFDFDALATLNSLNLYSYCYRDTKEVNGKTVYLDKPNADCAKNGKKVGYMADDPTTPVQLAGKHHDHFDAGALATFDAAAIKQEDAKVDALSRRLDGLQQMVLRLCHLKKNRKEAICRAFAH